MGAAALRHVAARAPDCLLVLISVSDSDSCASEHCEAVMQIVVEVCTIALPHY